METTNKPIKLGDRVLIAPEVTHRGKWVEGVVIDIHHNPFIGIVISVETPDKNVYFERAELFKPVGGVCMQ